MSGKEHVVQSEKPDVVSRVLFRLPGFRGKARLAHGFAHMVRKRNGDHAWCAPRQGARLEVSLGERMERLMWGGCWERHVQRCLELLLERGDCFIDVGAHIGYHTVVAAALVGERGRVYAFEPDPALHARLVRNTRDYPWVQPVPEAVSDRSTQLTFERSPTPGESGWGSLTTVRDFGKGEHIRVEVTSLDDWCRERSISNLKAIKVDAEGAEPDVVCGARQTIERYRPALIVEINEAVLQQAGASSGQLLDALRGLDYRLFAFDRHALSEVQPGTVPPSSEILALARKLADEQLALLNGTRP